MKKRIPTFVAGMFTMALLGGLGFSALAAAGSFNITVDPINIQVNGETFQPKNEKGEDVPVFALDGTTYAPLRALAKAYGLEVGYDSKANMASVTDPDAPAAPETPPTAYSDWSADEEAAYQEFKGMWEIEPKGTGAYDRFICGDEAIENLEQFLQAHTSEQITALFYRLAKENFSVVNGTNLVIYQFCGLDASDYLWFCVCYPDGVRNTDFNYAEVIERLKK